MPRNDGTGPDGKGPKNQNKGVPNKKIIIIGSRRRNNDSDYHQVYNEFKKWYDNGDIIISGGCPKGGDRFAEIIARKMNITESNGQLIIHRPDPSKKPENGSPKHKWAQWFYERNTVVAKESEPDTVVIAWNRRYFKKNTKTFE